MANQVDFKILPSDQFNVYSPQTRSEKIITYFTLLSKLRGDILAVSSQDDPNNIVSAYYSNVGNTQTLHLVKADGSEITASNDYAGTVTSVGVSMPSAFTVTNSPITTSGTIQITGAGTTAQYIRGDGTLATFPALTGFVPYVGATQNVDLGEYQIKAGQVAFDLTPTGTAGVGIMRWNDQDGTVDLGLIGGNVNLQIGQEQVVRVVNKSGINLTEAGYQAVKITGAQGNRLKVGLAQGNNDFNSADTIGLVTENIALNAEGFVTSSGLVRNIDTTGALQGETWADGDVIYLSPTIAGAVTKIKPTAPQHTVILGFVVRAHQTQGQIYVKVDNGYELEELHDVAPTPYVNNGVLYRNTTTNLWKSATIPTLLGYTPANAATTISTTAPLSGGGDLSANRTLSISQAGASTDGYLSSTDWNTFNNKQGALTFTAPLVNTSGTITITQSGASTNGYLSSTDWNTFNNKASDAFKTIAVAGQSNIVADSAADTLTFEAGSNIVITTDAATDKITITAIGGGSGSVTSVDMSVPTGFSISGNPITTSGTLALAFASGYSLPTNASQATWDTAYNNSITAFAYNTSTGVLTLTQQDAGTLTATVTLQPFTTDNLTQGSTNLYDKVVSLTGAGTTVVTGTYPNFTITSNDQHVGTVTSIATSAPITGGTITTSGTIGITQSGTAADGYLSSTDWNTFNSKVGGSGTINYVSKWTSTGAIGNSQIFDSGTYVGINTATPAAKLDISGAHVASIGLLRLNASAANIAAQTYYIDSVYKGAVYASTDDNFYILGRDADIVFSTTSSATARMTITNGGNVGIGTASPTQKLMVSGSVRVTGGYYDSSNSIGSNGQVLASTGSGTTWINASGGTVNGSGTVNYLSKWTGTTLLADSQLFDNGTNVGIGTATPNRNLTISGNGTLLGLQSNTAGGYSEMEFTANSVSAAYIFKLSAGNSSYAGAGSFNIYNSGAIGFHTASVSNAMFIASSTGNIGLGNTGPTQKLHVEGNIRVTGAYYDSANGAGSSGQVLSSTGSGTSWITPFSGSGTTNYVSKWTSGTALGNSSIYDNGNVGIGTTAPNTKLRIQESGTNPPLAIQNTNVDGYTGAWLYNSAGTLVGHFGWGNGTTTALSDKMYFGTIAAKDVVFTTSDTEKVRITSAGNVGIGTTSPSRLLHVAGNAQVDGWLFQGGYYTGSVTLPYPGANYGNGRIYLRLCSSASGRIMTAKVRISSTWNWAPAFGSVEADISFYWTGSSLAYAYVNILSATGQAATNLTFGALEVEGGSISVPVYSTNSNPIYAYIQLSPDADPSQVSYSTWGSVAFPGQSNVYVQTSLGVGTAAPSAKLQVSGGDGIINNAFIGEVPTYTSANAQFSHTSRAGAGEYSFLSANDGETFINSKTGTNIRFRVNNNDKVIITSGGNVGIGNTSPSQILHVTGNVRVTGAYYDSSNAAGTSGQILSSTGTGTAWISPGGGGGIITGSGTTNYVTKWTGTSAVGDSSIFDNGNVGIGTATPAAKLDVNGTFSLLAGAGGYWLKGEQGNSTPGGNSPFLALVNNNSIASATYGWLFYDSNADGSFNLYRRNNSTTSNQVLTISRSTGGVGIGTTTPQKPLEVISGVNDFVSVGVNQISVGNWTGIHFGYREANSSYRKSAIVFERTDLTANDAQGKIHILNGPQGGSGSATLADAKLTIAENGNVGVGATSPTSKFTIIAGANSFEDGSNAIRIEYPGSPSNGEIGGGLVFAQRWFSGAPDSLVRTGGIYGVKTNTNGAYGGGLVFYTQPNNGDPMGERMRINSLGSVGINTTNPGYKLDVIGSVRSYGGLFSNGYHGDTYIENLLPAANNGAGTGDVQLRMWCSEPGVTWAWAGFGYNVKNDGASPYGFGRVNTSFGQAYMRFSTEGNLFFYNTNTSGTRVTTMTLTNAGNVGIGTTSPQGNLDITGSTSGDLLYLDAAVNTDFAFKVISGADDLLVIRRQHISAGGLDIASFGYSGNVGIGNTAPSQKLHVSGNIRVTGAYYDSANGAGTSGQILSSTGTGTAWIAAPSGGGVSGSGTTNYVTKWTSGSAVGDSIMYDAGNGIGVGTTTPLLTNPGRGNLTVNGSSDAVMTLGISNSWASYWYVNSTAAYLSAGNPRALVLEAGGSARMFITSSGDIGVGTTSPGAKLHVIGNVGGGSGYNGGFYADTGSGSGIDTNWGFDFSKGGGDDYSTRVKFYPAAGSSRKLGFYDARNNSWLGYFDGNVNSNPNFVFGGSGNVGIGTTSPNAKLDVAGGINTRNTRVNSAEKYPVGHYSFGETVFEIDPTWTEAQLQDFFNVSGVSWIADSTAPGGYAIQIDGSANVGAGEYDSGFPYIPVDSSQDDWYYMECYIRNDSGSSIQHYMGGIDFNQNFASLGGNPGSYTYNVMFNYNPGTSWTKVYGYWNGFGSSYGSAGTGNTNNWVSGTKYFTPQALFNYGLNSGIRRCYISGWKCVRVRATGNRYYSNNVLVAGNVGVGTTTPDAKLVITGDGSGTAKIGPAGFGSNYTGISLNGTLNTASYNFLSSTSDNHLYINRPTGNDIYFRVANNDQVTIKSGGNVGIGTTAPSAKLHIQGAATDNVGLALFENTWSGGGIYYPSATFINTRGDHSYGVVAGFKTGSVGGTSDRPSILFYSDSASHSWAVGQVTSGWGSADSFGIGYRASNDPNSFGGWPTNYFTILTGGNVGIGTTAPAYKLDVSGTIRATGDVIAYSDARVKENVETLDGALDKVMKMRGVSYNKIGEQEKKVGVIAQEILEVLPEVVSQDETGTYSVAYGNIVSVLIEAIKEQQKQIDELKSKLK